MLTFANGKSQGFQWVRQQNLVDLPDENFAREIMQLFTIGNYELNIDGTRKVDAHGKYIQTYTNDDIMEIARAFTGFKAAARRGNSVAQNGNGVGNRVDPMVIRPL
jgi:uncharacterized protein (DUF1800 family)